MNTVFVTGALGAIGAWVVKHLVERGDRPVVYDLGGDPRRIRDVLGAELLASAQLVHGDVTNLETTKRAVAACSPSAIVHLAGLHETLCKADPALGARIDVIGTIHVFEAAAAARVQRVVYASSASVLGPVDDESAAIGDHGAAEPATHGGVFKRANEGTARVYWLDKRVASAGLRVPIVYGPGRDQGLTAGITTAMKAAVIGRTFRIGFRGVCDLQYVADTAAAFVACADGGRDGALRYNLHGDVADVGDIVAAIEDECPQARGRIAIEGPRLPVPARLDDRTLRAAYPHLPHTALATGVHATIERFRKLHAAGKLDTRDLGSR